MKADNIALSEKEKDYLLNYEGDNPFIKSLQQGLNKYNSLTDPQVNALRNHIHDQENKGDTPNEVCETTGLELDEECMFFEEDKKLRIKIKVVRPKAICMLHTSDEEGDFIAWVPKKALDIENLDVAGTSVKLLKLASWFDKDTDFWKADQKPQKDMRQEEKMQEAIQESEDVKKDNPDTLLDDEMVEREEKEQETSSGISQSAIDDLYAEDPDEERWDK